MLGLDSFFPHGSTSKTSGHGGSKRLIGLFYDSGRLCFGP